jgi:hypothetical protein
MPWLVTHAVARADGVSELHGVACGDLAQDLARVEGLRVVVELPAPRVLGTARLEGEGASRVPVYARGVALDPVARLEQLALFLLEGLPAALERDVPGARLEIRVGNGS